MLYVIEKGEEESTLSNHPQTHVILIHRKLMSGKEVLCYTN